MKGKTSVAGLQHESGKAERFYDEMETKELYASINRAILTTEWLPRIKQWEKFFFVILVLCFNPLHPP